MKLSTKTRYGTRAMVDIAAYSDEKPVHLKDLAQRQEISLKYLEQIVPSLKAAGLIRSIRGASGGYVLAREAKDIKLAEIVQALEGSLCPVECVENPRLCSRTIACAVHDIWCDIYSAMRNVLENTTLEDLLRRQQEKERLLGIED